MTEEAKTRQTAEGTRSPVESGQSMETGGTRSGAESSRPGFNRYIYENLICHVEGQIESWNRKAVRDPNPDVAHALWLKAEGLGYALRLLYADG